MFTSLIKFIFSNIIQTDKDLAANIHVAVKLWYRGHVLTIDTVS